MEKVVLEKAAQVGVTVYILSLDSFDELNMVYKVIFFIVIILIRNYTYTNTRSLGLLFTSGKPGMIHASPFADSNIEGGTINSQSL